MSAVDQGQGKPVGRLKFEKAVARSLLPPHLRATAMAIAAYADYGNGGNIYPGYERLAKDMGVTPRTARRNVKELRKLGWLFQVSSGHGMRVGGPRGGGLAAIWQLCKPLHKVAQGDHERDIKGTSKGHDERDTHDPPPQCHLAVGARWDVARSAKCPGRCGPSLAEAGSS
jgi:Helix-turn-helix domain